MQISDGSEQCVGRKQSASDLQSRLKTRKLLGVGELVGDNGDIYRSKISQLLGINESLYVRLPRGLLIWNSLLTVYIYVTGAMCMFAPSLATYIEFGYATPPTDLFPFRMYGAVMLTFGLLFRGLLALKDTRSEISVLLLVCAMLFLLQLLVTFFTCRCTLMLTSLRVIGVIGSLIYQSLLDGQSGTLRQFIRYVEDLFMHADNTPSRSSSCDEREKDKTS
ncbi:hypothetical protein AB6A40_010961 [Gnathostoma spinigerum]|uniref:Tumor protein p53-inducible protein 11 n=1 Tax=Gnathostoma spinigerum TaxID=75299 RepID=A0ABD6EYT4_9BILA